MSNKSTPAITSGNAIVISTASAGKVQPLQISANVATTTSLGVIQVGSGLAVTPAGVLSASGGGSVIIGTWTPTITVSPAGTVTLTTATASYAKIGQQVICYFDVTVATRAGGANNNILTLNGLPFASVAGVGIVGSLITTYFENVNTNQTYITGTIAGSSTQVLLWDVHQSASMSRLTYADIQAGASPTRLIGTITYLSGI